MFSNNLYQIHDNLNNKSQPALSWTTFESSPTRQELDDLDLRERAAKLVMRSLGKFDAAEAEKVYGYLKGRYEQ